MRLIATVTYAFIVPYYCNCTVAQVHLAVSDHLMFSTSLTVVVDECKMVCSLR